MADAVRLEITVDDKGSPVIKTVTDNLDRLARQSARTATENLKLNNVADQAVRVFGNFGVAVGGAVSQVAGALGPVGLLTGLVGTALTLGAAKASNALRDLAFQTRDLKFVSGGTEEQVSGLIDVLDDYGVQTETVRNAMVYLSRAIQEGSPALDRLGVSVRTTHGNLKSAHDLFYEVLGALRNLKSETDRNSIAQEVFSRGWTAMIPVVELGAEKLREAADASKFTLSAEDIKRADDYRKAVSDLTDQWERLKVAVGRGIIAPITVVIKWAADVGEFLGALAKPHAGFTLDDKERQRLLEQMDPTGALRKQLPDRTSGDVGAWRRGLPGAKEFPPSGGPGVDETPAEKKAREEREKRDRESWVKHAEAVFAQSDAEAQALAKIWEQYWKDRDATAKAYREQELANALESLQVEQEAWAWYHHYARTQAEETERVKEDARTRSDAGWVAHAEAIVQRDFETAQAQAKIYEDYWKQRDATAQAYRDQEAANALESMTVEQEAWFYYWKYVREQADLAQRQMLAIFKPIQDAVSGMVRGVLEGTQTLEEGFRRMGQNIAATLFENIVTHGLKLVADALTTFAKSLSASSSGWGSIVSALAVAFGGAKAEGGPVSPDKVYLVGERGPEWFVPRTNGTIVPTPAYATTTTNVYVDARGSQRGVSTEVMAAIRSGMNQAVRVSMARVYDERRRGGMRE